jgi:ABC-2 type transport system permease protein
MRAVLAVEALKLRRSTVARVATLVLAGLLPALAAGFMAAYLAGGDSQLAAKAATMVTGRTWAAYLGLMAQLLSVGALLAVGVVVCWVFGREYSDGTIGSLYALPAGRAHIAWAKAVIVLGWGLATSVLGALVAVPLGLTLGLATAAGPVEVLRAAALPVAVAVLTTLLALPLALVASAGRGYLAGIGALLGIVVVTQIITILGAGAWFPWAAPGLWSGMGGPAAAAAVTGPQLALPVLVGVVGVWGTARWWRSAEVV